MKAYKAGHYEQALELFNQAAGQQPDNPLALYNQGTALYRLGNFAEAAQAFSASAHRDPNPTARARAAYNQGRALLAEAGTKEAAAAQKERLLAGAQAFQQALRDDPGLTAARKGIEDFRKEYAKLSSQPPPPGQEQPQPGKQGQGQQGQPDQSGQSGQPGQSGQSGQSRPEIQDQLTKAGQQQQQLANQSREAAAGQNQPPSPQELQDSAAQQQSVRHTLEQLKKELDAKKQGQADDHDTSELTTELAQAITAQKKAEEALKKGNLAEAQKQQQQAADKLHEMAADHQAHAAQETETNDSNENEPTTPAAQAEEPGNHQDQAAAKTASTVADILDGEKALHEMRLRRRQHQRPAGGKDW